MMDGLTKCQKELSGCQWSKSSQSILQHAYFNPMQFFQALVSLFREKCRDLDEDFFGMEEKAFTYYRRFGGTPAGVKQVFCYMAQSLYFWRCNFNGHTLISWNLPFWTWFSTKNRIGTWAHENKKIPTIQRQKWPKTLLSVVGLELVTLRSASHASNSLVLRCSGIGIVAEW